MTLAVDAPGSQAARPATSFGHRLAPAGDPLEGAAFDAIYTAKIEPELTKREAERRGAMKTFVLAIAAGCVVVFLESMLAPSFTGGVVHVVGWQLAVPTLVAAALIGYMPLRTVARNAKVGIITSLCEPLGITYTVSAADPPSYPTFHSLNLLPSGDKAFEDFFSGRRGDVDFTLWEASLHQGSGKNRRLVFQGQLFRLVTPRQRTSTTVLLRNNGGWLKNFQCPSGLKPVGLEDPVFNRDFCVFSSDQVESREVLTPAFMQQLVDLESAYGAGHIRCAFTQGELLIALECSNQFEVGSMFANLVDRSQVEGIARNIEQVFKMIDEFKAA